MYLFACVCVLVSVLVMYVQCECVWVNVGTCMYNFMCVHVCSIHVCCMCVHVYVLCVHVMYNFALKINSLVLRPSPIHVCNVNCG